MDPKPEDLDPNMVLVYMPKRLDLRLRGMLDRHDHERTWTGKSEMSAGFASAVTEYVEANTEGVRDDG